MEQVKPSLLTSQKIAYYGKDELDFGTFEHNFIGEQVSITSERSLLDNLKLPNSLVLSFGQIVALGGDFYGVPKHPIIDPSNQTDPGRYQRFITAYNSLARAPKDKLEPELNKLLAALDKETRHCKCMKAKKWDEITGGKWFGFLPIKHGRMLKLAKNNHDHFLPYAKEAYLTGHQLAMDKARDANSKTDTDEREKLLHEALSLDAFACHFLTDSFASGHIRTPRVALTEKIFPTNFGNYLSKCMHDEDGKYGLHVTNKRGDKWVAYGDGMLLDEKNKDNLKFVTEAVQKSVDQVVAAYHCPSKVLDVAGITDIIPLLDKEAINHPPLFQVKDGKLYRRSMMSYLKYQKTTIKCLEAVASDEMRRSTL